MPPLPSSLRRRLLSEDDDAVVFCIDDDRGAQRIAVGFGTLAVAGLIVALGWVGQLWPGLVGVAGLVLAVVTLTGRFGRRAHRLALSREGWQLDQRPLVAWGASRPVALRGAWLWLGPARLPLHGESEEVRDALLAYVIRLTGP